jgi:hypothetical protein
MVFSTALPLTENILMQQEKPGAAASGFLFQNALKVITVCVS